MSDVGVLEQDGFYSFSSAFSPIQNWYFSPSPCVSHTHFEPLTFSGEREDRAIERDALVTSYLGKHIFHYFG